MLFSYIVGHVPVTFRKFCLKNEKVIKKKKSTGFFTHPLIAEILFRLRESIMLRRDSQTL